MPLPFETARHEALRKLANDRFGEITPAEDEVLRRSASNDNAETSKSNDQPEIKAEFLRWLATEKDAALHIDPLGIRVSNATILAVLDLDFCRMPVPLRFDFCTLQEQTTFRDANLPAVYLFDCVSRGISADGLTTTGNVFLRRLEARGEIRLLGAQIGGDLDCSGATLKATDNALSAGGAKIMGNVFLNDGFSSTGEIGLLDAQIGGTLDCGGATLTATKEALSADRARITGGVYLNKKFSSMGTVTFDGAQIGGDLDCRGAMLKGSGDFAMSAEGAKINGDVNLESGFSSTGEVRFLGAEIGGDLSCSGATLHGTGAALSAHTAKIGRHVFLRDGFSSTGEIGLLDAQIGGTLDCGGATLTATKEALSAGRARITGGVFLNKVSSMGTVSFAGAQIGGILDCGGATLTATKEALSAEGAKINGDVNLKSGFSSTGEVRFLGAEIGGDLNCSGATLHATGAALSAHNAKINGNVFFSDKFSSTGTVALTGAQIGGNLDCSGATLTATGDALSAHNAKINGNVFLDDGFSSTGAIGFIGAEIGGVFDCEGATLTATGDALTLEKIKVNGSAFLRLGFSSSGTILLFGAQISGNLVFDRATLTATGDAVNLENSRITGDISLKDGFSSTGTIRLDGAQFGGTVDFDGATLAAPPQVALQASRANIAGGVRLRYGFSSLGAITLQGTVIGGNLECVGSNIAEFNCEKARIAGDLIWAGVSKPIQTNLKLTGTTVTTLHDECASWPCYGKLHLQDFVYQDVVAHVDLDSKIVANPKAPFDLPGVRNLRAEDRIDWLRRQPKDEIANAQPWLQLSKFLQSNGDPEGAKRVLYEYHRQQASITGMVRRFGSLPLDILEEQPLWIAPVIATFGLVGSFLFWRADRIRAMAPTGKDALAEFEKEKPLPGAYPPFNPIVYALENVLPVVKLGQDTNWAPIDPPTPGTWLPEWPAWLRSLAARWTFTRWLVRLDYQRLALLRWGLIILGWASALILGAAIGARFKE